MPVQFNEEVIRAASIGVYSVHGLLIKLGLKGSGANHRTYKRLIAEYNIKFEPAPLNHRRPATIRPISDYLVKNGPHITSGDLRRKLIAAGLKREQCENPKCNLGPEWCGKLLRLHLDHIDGDHFNNELKNLRILCPNCHSQTETYGALKQKKIKEPKPPRIKTTILIPKRQCKKCGGPVSTRSILGLCRKCFVRPRKVENRPTIEVLQAQVDELGYGKTGKLYGVSYRCIMKWLGKSKPAINSADLDATLACGNDNTGD